MVETTFLSVGIFKLKALKISVVIKKCTYIQGIWNLNHKISEIHRQSKIINMQGVWKWCVNISGGDSTRKINALNIFSKTQN